MTLAALAPAAAHVHGGRIFLERWSSLPGKTPPPPPLSFVAFADRVHAACWLLADAGVSSGDRVAILAHASADTLALCLAVPTLGAVLVQLNWRQPESTLTTMICRLGCSVLIGGRGFAAKARRLCTSERPINAETGARSPTMHTLLLTDDAAALEPDSSPIELEVHVSCDTCHRREGLTLPSVSPDAVAVIMFTSGTSALPKPVPLTHRGLLWSCRAKAHAERSVFGLVGGADSSQYPQEEASIGDRGWTEHRGTLAFLPIFHVIGFTNNFLHNLLAGVSCTLLHAAAPGMHTAQGTHP